MKFKKKIKLYIFHPYSGFGGADLSISRLINGLDQSKYEIDFISLNEPNIRRKINKKVNYKKLLSKRTFSSFFEIKKYIKKDNKNYKKKIFISNQYFANILSILYLSGFQQLKIVLLERNHLDELNYYGNYQKLFKNIIIFCYAWVKNRINFFFDIII